MLEQMGQDIVWHLQDLVSRTSEADLSLSVMVMEDATTTPQLTHIGWQLLIWINSSKNLFPKH